MKHLHFVLIAAFFLLCSLPGLQLIFNFAKDEKLHGVEEAADDPFPAFDLSSLLRDKYQSRLEEWLGRNVGFRGHLVRTDNQINYSLFNQISSNYASPLVVGTENTLFEKLYIDSVNGRGLVPDKELRRLARKLARLQELLEARGVGFLLLISPAKTTLEMDRVPTRYLDPKRPPDEKSNYRRLVPFLQSAGVRTLDARELLLKWKSESAKPLFAKGGTHWTMETSCRVSREMIAALEAHSPKKFPPLRCEPVEIRPVPEPFDRDLADLCNLRSAAPFYEPLPYPVETPDPAAPPGPKMLFVGGSFLWSMFHYLDELKIYSERDMYYYFNRRFRFPSLEIDAIDRRTVDWKNEVFEKDFIVLEVNEANIRSAGSGFIDAALGALNESDQSDET